jgi:hypothetical protein
MHREHQRRCQRPDARSVAVDIEKQWMFVPPDLSSQQRVEDGESHHRQASPEDRPSGPERDGSADNRKGGAERGHAEQGQSICRTNLHSNHLTPPIIAARKEGRVGGPGFRHSSRYHHFRREPNWLARAVPQYVELRFGAGS